LSLAEARIAELERKLAAKEKTISVLIARVERQYDSSSSSLGAMQGTRALEQVVEQKTVQLDCERNKLQAALQNLQRAQAELLQAGKLTAIGQLAAGIAHEINTPMQFVGDNTHFLQRAFGLLLPILEKLRSLTAQEQADLKLADEFGQLRQMLKRAKVDILCREVPRALDGSLEGIKRVTNIVRAMKEFSHPSSGDLRPAKLKDVIESTLEVTRNVWKYTSTVETNFDPDLPDVPCLRDELNQVILNLIVNASDAIAERTQLDASGLGQITIRTRRVDGCAQISIADNGSGMPEHVRARVFEPFFTTKAIGKGTGQGLAIAYSVVTDKHGGKIRLESELGRGTTFYIELPLAPPECQP
jgi:two-component system NtrC family sensor kinase